MLISATSDLETLTSRNTAVKHQLETKRTEVEVLAQETALVQSEAKRLLEVCKATMSTPDLALREFFSNLPEGQTAEELEGEIESEQARLELMHEGNGGVIREFEQREKKIDVYRTRIREYELENEEVLGKIAEVRGRWEPELEGLVKLISDSFAFNMRQINCAGEVGVFKDELLFDQWAIHIRVKFRYGPPISYTRPNSLPAPLS